MLIDQALSIIENERLTMDDIAELSRILVGLSVEQYKYGELSAQAEHNYQMEKAQLIDKSLTLWLPYNKSETKALNLVEKKYWDYRINREKAKWFASICARIDSVIKMEMHRNKLDAMAQDASINL